MWRGVLARALCIRGRTCGSCCRGGGRRGGIRLGGLISGEGGELGGGELPSRNGLLQIGQSIEGLRSLLGTRSSSRGGGGVSGGSDGMRLDGNAVLGF